jgi:hypothetical protein
MFLGKSRNKFEKVGTFDEHVIAHPEKNRLKPYNQNQLNVKLLIWKFKKIKMKKTYFSIAEIQVENETPFGTKINFEV